MVLEHLQIDAIVSLQSSGWLVSPKQWLPSCSRDHGDLWNWSGSDYGLAAAVKILHCLSSLGLHHIVTSSSSHWVPSWLRSLLSTQIPFLDMGNSFKISCLLGKMLGTIPYHLWDFPTSFYFWVSGYQWFQYFEQYTQLRNPISIFNTGAANSISLYIRPSNHVGFVMRRISARILRQRHVTISVLKITCKYKRNLISLKF
jgi:hypothetical protein